MPGMNAETLFKQIEAYRPLSNNKTALRESDPYLFKAVDVTGGDIPGNADFSIEELTDDDLDCAIGIA